MSTSSRTHCENYVRVHQHADEDVVVVGDVVVDVGWKRGWEMMAVWGRQGSLVLSRVTPQQKMV